MLGLPKLKLIHDVCMMLQVNTTLDMLERYTEQQPAIYAALLDKDVKKSTKDIAMLSDNEQKLAEDAIQLLKPLKMVTTLMSSETNPTASLILPLKSNDSRGRGLRSHQRS